MDTNTAITFEQVKYTWIKALPSAFTDLHTKFNKNDLDDEWTNIKFSAELFIRTLEEMNNCNISFQDPSPSKDPKDLKATKITSKFLKTVPSKNRGAFPPDFPDTDKLHTQVKELIDSGMSRKEIETMFKDPYGFNSCWL